MGNPYNKKWVNPKIFNGKLETEDIQFLDVVAASIQDSRAVALHRCIQMCQHIQRKNPSLFNELLGLANDSQQ